MLHSEAAKWEWGLDQFSKILVLPLMICSNIESWRNLNCDAINFVPTISDEYEVGIEMIRLLKRSLDPNNMLAPGRIFDL